MIVTIDNYIKDLQKYGFTQTSDIGMKWRIIEYLKAKNKKFTCRMDEFFQYTILLLDDN
jgi:hypothetical protein